MCSEEKDAGFNKDGGRLERVRQVENCGKDRFRSENGRSDMFVALAPRHTATQIVNCRRELDHMLPNETDARPTVR